MPEGTPFFLCMALNFGFGALIGYIANCILAAVSSGGDMINTQMGLSSAMIMDPSTKSQTSLMSNFFSILAMLIFIYSGGIYWLFNALIKSFELFPMYAVCSAKDGLFTTFLLLSVVMLLKLGENKHIFFKKKRNIFFLSLSLILMMMFRNNGSYAYVAWLLVPMAIGVISTGKKNSEKKYYRSLLLLLILPLGLSMIFSYGLEKGLKAKKGGSQEIMTVPIQQMARVYKYAPETYSEKEKEILYEILPKEELHLYTPRISDLLKSKFNSQAFRQHPLKYIGLWSKIGMRKPLIYLNGWLLTSYGYWYPDAVINVYGGNPRHTIVYEDSSYFGFETEPPGIRESKFPLLEKIYRKISLELFQQKIPAVSLFFSPGFTFWVYLWGVTYLWYQKRWEVFIPFLLILFVWLTVILGPTYLVRYVLVIWFALPLLISVLKAGEKDESKD